MEEEHKLPTEEDRIGLLKKTIAESTRIYRATLPKFGWVGIATNAYKDKTGDILPLGKISEDIARKSNSLLSGRIKHYGLLDIMHDHDMTVGVCAYRKIIEGTRMEIDFGYFNPEYDDVASAIKSSGRRFTMSHEFSYWLGSSRTCNIRVPQSLSSYVSAKTAGLNYVQIDTFRFTIADAGEEANERTLFKVYNLGS